MPGCLFLPVVLSSAAALFWILLFLLVSSSIVATLSTLAVLLPGASRTGGGRSDNRHLARVSLEQITGTNETIAVVKSQIITALKHSPQSHLTANISMTTVKSSSH